MYAVGDYVVKANKGVCKVEDITKLTIPNADRNKLYYLLIPLEDAGAKLYVPVEGVDQNIRPVITEAQAWDLIDHINDIDAASIPDEKQREARYKEALHSCEPEQVVSVLKSIYLRKAERDAQGKKITAVDDRYFKIAEDVLHSELAFAIGRDKHDMRDVIAQKIK